VGSPTVNPYTARTMTCDMCRGDAAGPWCVAACKCEGALALVPRESLTRRAAREGAARTRPVRPA
jgi:Fe-S-cluster-containing hydrogenase component 2